MECVDKDGSNTIEWHDALADVDATLAVLASNRVEPELAKGGAPFVKALLSIGQLVLRVRKAADDKAAKANNLMSTGRGRGRGQGRGRGRGRPSAQPTTPSDPPHTKPSAIGASAAAHDSRGSGRGRGCGRGRGRGVRSF